MRCENSSEKAGTPLFSYLPPSVSDFRSDTDSDHLVMCPHRWTLKLGLSRLETTEAAAAFCIFFSIKDLSSVCMFRSTAFTHSFSRPLKPRLRIMQSNVTSRLRISSYKSGHIHHFERQRGLRGCRIRRPRQLHVCDTATCTYRAPLRFKLNICPVKICSQAAEGLTCVCPDTTLRHTSQHSTLILTKPETPLVCRTVRIQYRSRGPNDIDRSVKTGKEHTGGHRGQNRHQKRFYFLKALRTSGDLKPSGTVIECEGQWIPQMCT